MHWSNLDYVILGIAVLSVMIGLIRGLLREVISLITWFFAFVAALEFSPWVAQLLHQAISHTMTRYIVSGFLIFVAVLIVGAIIRKLIHLLVSATGFGLLDRLLGLIFGAARGALCVTVMLLLIGASPYKDAAWTQQSQLAPYFQPLVTCFVPLLPKDLTSMADLVARLNAHHLAQLAVRVA